MKRTDQQRKALEVAFKLLADSLNDAGLDQRTVLKPSVEIPWTQEAVKNQLWRPIQFLMLNKKSTTQLEKTGEIEKVWDVLMRHLGEKFHVEYIPFPHNPERAKENIEPPQRDESVEYPEYDGEVQF